MSFSFMENKPRLILVQDLIIWSTVQSWQLLSEGLSTFTYGIPPQSSHSDYVKGKILPSVKWTLALTILLGCATRHSWEETLWQKNVIYIQYHAVNTFAFTDGKRKDYIKLYIIKYEIALLRSQINWNENLILKWVFGSFIWPKPVPYKK